MNSKTCGDAYWTTDKEKAYIDSIGTHMDGRMATNARSKCEFLKGYISGARKRARWGAVDADEVIRYAESVMESI